MSTAPQISGASIDALRSQIEDELRAEMRRHRLRIAMVAAGLALLASLTLNILVIAWPGAVGLASADDLDTARQEIAATATAAERAGQETLALSRSASQRASRATVAARQVPAICATVGELGDWSFVSGEAPALECAPRD